MEDAENVKNDIIFYIFGLIFTLFESILRLQNEAADKRSEG